VVDGVMYLTTAWSMLKAYDIHTGALLWAYDPKVDRAKGADACCDVVNRGVAAWNGKIYLGALDGRPLSLLDRENRQGRLWSVAESGRTPALPTPFHRRAPHREGQGRSRRKRRQPNAACAATCSRPAVPKPAGGTLWRWWTMPGGDPSKPYEQPELADAAKTWKGDNLLEDRRRRHCTGWHRPSIPNSTCSTSAPATAIPWNQKITSPGGGDDLSVVDRRRFDADAGGARIRHYRATRAET